MKDNLKTVSDLIAEAQAELFGWIPAEQYEKMHPSENRERIRGRIRRKVWQPGVHFSYTNGKEMWIHLRNVKAWIEKRQPEETEPPG